MFIYIKDIEMDGCEFLAPGNSVVVGVKTARAAIEEEVEEEVEGKKVLKEEMLLLKVLKLQLLSKS